MVVVTRIELVTPAMSRQCSPTELHDQIIREVPFYAQLLYQSRTEAECAKRLKKINFFDSGGLALLLEIKLLSLQLH